jgi:hypothetical protein
VPHLSKPTLWSSYKSTQPSHYPCNMYYVKYDYHHITMCFITGRSLWNFLQMLLLIAYTIDTEHYLKALSPQF